MSGKSIIGVGVSFLLILSAVLCIRFVLHRWSETAAHVAANVAAHEAARDAVDKVAHQSIQARAGELARDAARRVTAETRPAQNVTAPSESTELERADYSITLPAAATVDPADADLDKDHMTAVNLPHGVTLLIYVVDDKKAASEWLDRLTDGYKAKMTDASVTETRTFDKINPQRSRAATGTIKGQKFAFEMGQFEGNQKAFMLVVIRPEQEKATTEVLVESTLKTFKLKA